MYNGKGIAELKSDRELPTVRIQKIVLEDFKSVKYGEIVTTSTKKSIRKGAKSNIIGIYGQNGSGKTSLIEALAVLKQSLTGRKIPDRYADMVRKGCDNGRLAFTFDFQFETGKSQTVVYEFSLFRVPKEIDDAEGLITQAAAGYGVEIRNEKISISGSFEDKELTKQVLIDTSSETLPFSPKTKYNSFIGKNTDSDIEFKLTLNKATNRKSASSFIFDYETLVLLCSCCTNNAYCAVLVDLALFANRFLFVLDTRDTGMIGVDAGLMLYFWKYDKGVTMLPVHFHKPQTIPKEICLMIEERLTLMNTVLCQIIPGMSIGLSLLGPTILSDGKEGEYFDLSSIRDGTIIPLRNESDGIKKIISVLNLFIAVYNQKSTTVAIDELDAGIFEYLLGEILKVIDASGAGQLIFTSHNLRPLEVLDNKSIVFTTTNENNRFSRMDKIQKNNNLRDTYFRSILLGGQKESLYTETETYEIERAFWKAGRDVKK